MNDFPETPETRKELQGGAPDRAISWAVIRDCLQALRLVASSLEPVSEREYIERALRIANWNGEDYKSFRNLEAAVLCGAQGVESDPALRDVLPDQPFRPRATVTAQERALILRDAFRKELTPLASDIEKCRVRAKDSLRPPGFTMKLPVRRVSKRLDQKGRAHADISIDDVYFHSNAIEALHFVRDLLIATNRPFGSQLRQCKLPSCGVLFLQEKVGHRPREYHHPDCMKIAHDSGGADRSRKSREKKQMQKSSRRKPK